MIVMIKLTAPARRVTPATFTQEAMDACRAWARQLVAGTETVGNALAWALYLISEHPGVARRLRDGDLPYARRVFTETLRLYPPGWIFSRVTTEDAELAGRRLPEGSTVMFSPYLLHRDPANFPDPDRFDPDRWLPARPAQAPAGAMIPFGGGNRKCIGDSYADHLGALALDAVTTRWRLLPAAAARPTAKATLGMKPLSVRLAPLTSL